MASGASGGLNDLYVSDGWRGVRASVCVRKKAKIPLDGAPMKCLLLLEMVALVLQSALAAEGEGAYEGSASTSLPPDYTQSAGLTKLLAGVLLVEEGQLARSRVHPAGAAESLREEPAFASILTMLAGSVEGPQTLVQTLASPAASDNYNGNQTNQEPSEDPLKGAESSVPLVTSVYPAYSSDEAVVSGSPPATATPVSSPSEVDATHLERGLASMGTSDSLLVDPTTTDASGAPPLTVTDASPETTTTTITTTTAVTDAARTTTVTSDTTTRLASTTQTHTSRTEGKVLEKTTMKTTTTDLTSTQTTTSATPLTFTSTKTAVSVYNASLTESPMLQCNVTEEMWVKTVLSVHFRGKRMDGALRQNLPRGLSRALQKALNLSTVQAQIGNVTGTWNVTVGYYAVSGSAVLTASTVAEALAAYGADRLLGDVKQAVPLVQAILLAGEPWRPPPDPTLLVKTVLRFVGPGDDITSCAFVQSMEQRLESVFMEAQSKVLNSSAKLSVQVLAAWQLPSSQAVALTYVVRNGNESLNGTVASGLLGQLSAELVGYFLFYPPLSIAEPLLYHNLNTSIATKDFWVITVLQYVDSSSLDSGYQNFARLMEQRLAQLFVVAQQQGARFRRATTVGGYTVQMVGVRRVPGPKNPAEMTYYAQLEGRPLLGTSAAKILNTVDSQTMALTLGYFVQLQAEPVVKSPPSNLWIIPAVLVPIAVVMVIVLIITAVLCRRNRGDFKVELNPRTKTSYRRDASFYHQPVQGFDYAKQHLGQQGGNEEAVPATQETIVLPLSVRDGPLLHQNGTASKRTLPNEVHRSEDGSVISSESGKANSCRATSAQRVPAQQKPPREEAPKRTDPYDSSGSLQLVSVQPAPPPQSCSHPPSSDRSQDSSILNGEVNMALKQKSDIERYRNKLRLKAKQRAHCDLPAVESSGRSRAHGHQRAPLDANQGSTYVKSSARCSQLRNPTYRSRQSLSSPSPGTNEMDLLVLGDRGGRGIRNSGYDTEPELLEETDIDRLMGLMGYAGGPPLAGHSEASTLSSQPSIDEVRQQMHLLLDEAFTLASSGHSTGGGRPHGPQGPHVTHSRPGPGSEVVTSAPGSIARPCGELHWAPAYALDLFPCSLPKPAFRFTQLPDMAMAPPPVPPRTGHTPGASLLRSTSDIGPKARSSECSMADMHSVYDSVRVPMSRSPLPGAAVDQHAANYSGNPITAVYASRPCCSGYSAATPPTSYRSPSWMSYPPEPEDLPRQWAGSNQCHLETIC
ncbi:UPF0606 protein KIAA1549L-like [Brienomyrus brachyistius]|uniref:UPF0606 protein KIAA1549L-like n=1 Tax=Brienomyrus brachyistius TaxID=42636 RepID=UPI0020B29BA4|nr:UPF0606 protein KIAA1549L-like [Brienomyrus brachyistius]XP_048829255.1 UPF0606 protein KIAA1549L-like [Brienomyrus brachyistius]